LSEESGLYIATAHCANSYSAYNLVALHTTKTVSCTLSIIGATFIIQHVLRSKKRRQRVLTRLILVMSVMDFIFALTFALGAMVIPTDAADELPFPTPMARGTWATCEAAGFLVAGSSHASILYNASLSLFYLLTIRYGWSEWKLKNHANAVVEPCLHAIPLIIGWGIAIPGLPLNLYNPFPSGCGTLR
jgi:heme A synthase